MPVTLRQFPRKLDDQGREPSRNTLHADWCLRISPSLVDGEWQLQLEGRWQRCVVALGPLAEAPVADLDGLLRRLTAAASQGPGPGRR